MISKLFILLLAAGFLAVILPKERYSRFVSVLLFAVGGLLLFNFYENWQLGGTHASVYRVLEYKQLYLDIDLSSSPALYALIFPFFSMAVLSLYNTMFSLQEEQRGRLGSLILLDVAFLFLLIGSNNLLLLLVGSSLIGIVGLYIINNFESKKTYVFYNLTADMIIFTAFSIVYASQNSIDLNMLPLYAGHGSNRRLVALLLLAGIFIKSGLFMFHNQIFSYRNLSFNRLIFLNYCVTPAAGLILFAKTQPLFSNFEECRIIIRIFAAASMAYGLGGMLIYDNVKEKALSLNMLLWGFVYGLAVSAEDFSLSRMGGLLVLFYLLNAWLQLVVRSFSDEIYISRMGGVWNKLWLLMLFGVILSFAVFQYLGAETENASAGRIWFWLLNGSMLLIVSCLFRQIFFGQSCCDERVSAFLKNPGALSWLPLAVISVWSVWNCGWYRWELAAAVIFCVLLVAFYPLRPLAALYERDEIQLSEFFERFYEFAVIAPLNILGRILWLTVDFLLIERTIINSFSNLTGVLINVSQRIHTPRLLGYVVMTVVGLGIIFMFLQVRP